MRRLSYPVIAVATLAVGGMLVGPAAFAALAPSAARQAKAPVPAATAAWRVVKTVTGSNFPQFTALTATGPRSAWAFEVSGNTRTEAWQLSGSTWTRRAFPGKVNEPVVSASSSSATNVWAFTFDDQAVRWNGSTWTVVKQFSGNIGSGLAVNRTDVWVFGLEAGHLGTWHFNGSGWTRVSSGRGLFGASALSPTSIWAYGSTSVAHWNGRSWTRTSVARLLPRNNEFSHWGLAGILAVSERNVWALASGGTQDVGGPPLLLHFNGTRWQRSATKDIGQPEAIVGDGRGGLWIPVNTGFPGSGSMLRFTGGTLRNVSLPIAPLHLALFGAAHAPNSTVAFTFGYRRTSFSSTTTTAVILRYGT
jgi:hypothetical protein